jgi:hypothetical protein
MQGIVLWHISVCNELKFHFVIKIFLSWLRLDFFFYLCKQINNKTISFLNIQQKY